MYVHELLKRLLPDARRADPADDAALRQSVAGDLRRIVRRALRAPAASPLTRHIRRLARAEGLPEKGAGGGQGSEEVTAFSEPEMLVQKVCDRLWEELLSASRPRYAAARSTVARIANTELAVLV